MTCMRSVGRGIGFAALVAATTSCGNVVTQSRSPVILVIDSLLGSRGQAGTSTTFGNPLTSDVITNVTAPDPCTAARPCPTVFGDTGQVTMRIVPKDIGTTTSPTTPSSNNAVTITRYHVAYRRADGRSTQGVDVPYAFDGATTVTVPAGGTVAAGIELVRVDAKKESPLVELRSNASILTLIADVTVYGRDLVGNDISATGSIQINVGNFGDF